MYVGLLWRLITRESDVPALVMTVCDMIDHGHTVTFDSKRTPQYMVVVFPA